jgi:hypothetical protein
MKILTEAIKDVETIAKNIADSTDNNAHTEAAIYLAQGLKNKSAEKALNGVLAIQDYFGSTTQDLQKVRSQITKELLDDIRHKVTKEEYDLIKGAF